MKVDFGFVGVTKEDKKTEGNTGATYSPLTDQSMKELGVSSTTSPLSACFGNRFDGKGKADGVVCMLCSTKLKPTSTTTVVPVDDEQEEADQEKPVEGVTKKALCFIKIKYYFYQNTFLFEAKILNQRCAGINKKKIIYILIKIPKILEDIFTISAKDSIPDFRFRSFYREIL